MGIIKPRIILYLCILTLLILFAAVSTASTLAYASVDSSPEKVNSLSGDPSAIVDELYPLSGDLSEIVDELYPPTDGSSAIVDEPVTLDGDRKIYVGDIITLEITAEDFSVNDIMERFSIFEIVDIKEKSGVYILSLRIFETGEFRTSLGNKEIVISVASTLDDIKRDEIFDGDSWVIKQGVFPPWQALLYTAASVFILSGGFLLIILVLKHRKRTLSPHQLFLNRSGALSTESANFFVDLTHYFKEYLESVCSCRIIGKTSYETVNELRRMQMIEVAIPDIQAWLTECDRMKFSGVNLSIEQKLGHYEKLIGLVDSINKYITGETDEPDEPDELDELDDTYESYK